MSAPIVLDGNDPLLLSRNSVTKNSLGLDSQGVFIFCGLCFHIFTFRHAFC